MRKIKVLMLLSTYGVAKWGEFICYELLERNES